MSKTESAADPVSTPPDAPAKGKAEPRPDLSGEVLRRLDALAKILAQHQAEVLAQLAEITANAKRAQEDFRALQTIVVNALPSRLLRLTSEHIKLLRDKAPTARVRLIAPFYASGGMVNLKEGEIFDVMDSNIKVYGDAMQLALVVGVADDVDAIVARLVDQSVRDLARIEEDKVKASQLAEAEAAEAKAAQLRAAAKG